MSKLQYRRFIIKALCFLTLSFYLTLAAMLNVYAATNSGNINDNLDKLETKLFQHTYAKDTPEDRLGRLENLIFGQNEKGSVDERVAALLKAVPNTDQPSDVGANKGENTGGASSAPTGSQNNAGLKQAQRSSEDEVSDQSQYPAVTAMETKLFGKDYADEPIKDRLVRLENKALGHASISDDLSERVDNLKQATGIDVAKKPGSMSDWLEDNDDMLRQQPRAAAGDVYQDMQRSSSSDGYTFNSPYFPDQPTHTPVSIKSFGLSQQVTALEHEVFHKTYEHDPLPARLNRLETTVFPDQKPAVDKPLPQRVDTLLAKVPISQKELQNLALLNGIDTKGGFDQTTNNNLANNGNSNSTNTANKQPSGLGKLMNSIGNMLSGGMQGGYAMNGGHYVVDPKTGMLIDPNTGVLVNPNTGTVYSAPPYNPGYSPYGYGMNPYGMGMGGFGMSPFGGYGMSPFGFGGGGMGMGFGFR